MRHLTPADYATMPWANGLGTTIEMVRSTRADGSLAYRLSLAKVAVDGPFSLFPGVKRNLTVISGSGFDLIGTQRLRADPLVPVAFSGEDPMSAAGVREPNEDFNVMVGRHFAWPDVAVLQDGMKAEVSDAMLFIFALAPAKVGPTSLGRHDLLVCTLGGPVTGGPVTGGPVTGGHVTGGPVIVVQIGLPFKSA